MGFIDKIPLLMLAQSQLADIYQSGGIETFPYRSKSFQARQIAD
jgi:hypothetical protein